MEAPSKIDSVTKMSKLLCRIKDVSSLNQLCVKISQELQSHESLNTKQIDKLKAFSSDFCAKLIIEKYSKSENMTSEIKEMLLEMDKKQLISPVHIWSFQFLFPQWEFTRKGL